MEGASLRVGNPLPIDTQSQTGLSSRLHDRLEEVEPTAAVEFIIAMTDRQMPSRWRASLSFRGVATPSHAGNVGR